MHWIDWLIVVAYFIGMLWVSIRFTKRASKGMEEYFISGRSLPWWLLGTSMVASAFASDTPLFVTNLVRRYGTSGAWYYWNASINGLISAFLFSVLWRRTNAITDAEMRELRYSGVSGRVARLMWALHQSLIAQILAMGWVILAMVKIGSVALGLPPTVTLPVVGALDSAVVLTIVSVVIGLLYSVMSGLWGVVVTDFCQFFIAFFGTFILAIIAIGKVGGPIALQHKMAVSPEANATFLNILPTLGTTAMVYFLVGLTIQWWQSPWVDGGIEMAQRMLAAKDERNAAIGRYWGNLAQMAIIVWPWAVVALCSIIIFPVSENAVLANDPERAYPMMMMLAPVVVRGLLVAAFLSAFMSTISTQFNLTSSYIVNDIYKRFLVRDASSRHYVLIGRVMTILVAIAGSTVAILSNEILYLSQLLAQITGGIGLIFVMRWLWWRINGWSEIAAYCASVITTIILNTAWGLALLKSIVLAVTPAESQAGITHFLDVTLVGIDGWPYRMVVICCFNVVVSISVTLLTPPTERKHLIRFYRQVKPVGPGWKPVASEAGPHIYEPGQVRFRISDFVVGSVFFYSLFAAIGKLLFGYFTQGVIALLISVISGIMLYRVFTVGGNPSQKEMK